MDDAMPDFAGRWLTTFGPMELFREGESVRGVYTRQGAACLIDGRLEGGRLVFRYREPGEEGEGWFEQARHGAFTGRWRADGARDWHDWHGHREWDGVWETSFGRLRLVAEPDRVVGFYEGAGPS